MEISEIKQKLSMHQVLAYYHLKPRNNRLCCPFHEDKTPSMQVFEDSNSVRCYSGNCIRSGKVIDVIDFIMYKERTSKHQAILKSAELAGLTPASRTKEYQDLPMDRLEEIFKQLQINIKKSPAAQKYLQQRCLNPQKLEIGYNGRGYKGIKNCLVFPLRNKERKIVSFYGRSVTASSHYYLKDREGLYPAYPGKDTKKLILTESVIDAASLQQIDAVAEHYEILAGYGVNGFTAEHRQAVKELKELREIILCYDNDPAGEESMKKLTAEFQKENPEIKLSRIDLPSKDVNETLQLHDENIFTELSEQRKTIHSGIESRDLFILPETKKESRHPQGLSLQTINSLIGKSGIIGEENTRLLLFIIASSYKTNSPLHGIVQGSSGSGKTHLISRISDLIPGEDVLRFTRITESSLYNWGEYDLVGKLLIIEDLDGLKEEALYALRELISSQRLSSSISVKDKKGNIKSTTKKVRGIFSSLSATTRGDTYEDNISRSFILAVDESSAQSRRIIDYQNQKYAGEVSKEQEYQTKKALQDYIRNLQDLEVVNPYASRLELPWEVHKIRRLNQMYQSIIRQITWLNQKNRRYSRGKICTEIEDLEQATEILFDSIVLKVDELDGSLRQFYERLKKYLKTKEREFTQREIRQVLNISKSQLQRYINHLLELDYIRQSGGHINRGIRYRIDYWDNFEKLRNRIKESLFRQIEVLKTEKNRQESVKEPPESA